MLPHYKIYEIWNSKRLRRQFNPKADDLRNPFSAWNHAVGFHIAFAEQGYYKFVTETLPTWWTTIDQAICDKFREWWEMDSGPHDEAGNPLEPEKYHRWDHFLDKEWESASFNCRRCAFWLSADGQTGQCHGPEMAYGQTNATSRCVQWDPRPSVFNSR